MNRADADRLEEFLGRVPDLESATTRDLVAYFVYFLTVEEQGQAVLPREVEECFRAARMPFTRVRQILNEGLRRVPSRAPLFVRVGSGYRLARATELRVQGEVDASPVSREVSQSLRVLEGRISGMAERDFLREAITCYEAKAFRAAILLVWLLTVAHLHEYVFRHRLSEFNIVLGSNTDKRVKIRAVRSRDDFADIPESKFIELLRSARIISNDVRKVLDAKLGIRNSYAHPSGIALSPVKASDFIVDLVTNVIQRLKL